MLTQCAPVPIAIKKENGDIEFLNDRFVSSFGYTTEDIPNARDFWRLAIADEEYRRRAMESWRAAGERARRDGTDIEPQQYNIICKNGVTRVVEMFGTRIGEKRLVMFSDVTERKQAEAELARHREQLEEMVWARTEELALLNQLVHDSLEAADVGAWWIDFRESDVFHALDITMRMMGLETAGSERRTYLLSDWHALLVETKKRFPEYTAAVNDSIERFFGTISGKYDAFRSVYPIAMRDGSVKWFDSRADVPTRDDRGRAMLMTGTIIDITRLKRSEEEIVRAREAAETASHAKTEFLSTMSHELRTPLNSIIGFAQVLADESFGGLSRQQREFAHDIQESGRHLLLLINDILDLAKIESGKMVLEPERVALTELVENSLVMIREKAVRHKLKLEMDLAPDVPPVLADEMRVRQVMYNLLSNAAKFTPDGGTIKISMFRAGEFVETAVSDTGIGIASEDQERIFRQFEQLAKGPGRKYGGTGLGLCISRDIVELHGGRMWMESEGEGKGAKFAFTLPVYREERGSV
ncbi:MAG: ATP-binding protein [Elusimicrobiaceae bacterium]|nr:ATP-binding protein [Elusimicrobiaceae bacterium]